MSRWAKFLISNIMSYTRFERHEYMGAETRTEIMDIIGEVRDNDYSRNLENMMYGLFDGYLYAEIQIILVWQLFFCNITCICNVWLLSDMYICIKNLNFSKLRLNFL